ncbi:hypothetical protein C9374_011190 [Naegleria lovaniensis]|uniref:Uncharacterized protein n=1 Tax=Naegleria lovaniensis TaxID=51637 RepID=A0AA88GCR7_NAELO|nr:uncharacterized protein C9374_011190 [Naegleria lovaniensis]KAG2374111.1 hypothetical protein C9374_011190 [Naegleria lovaniensis]
MFSNVHENSVIVSSSNTHVILPEIEKGPTKHFQHESDIFLYFNEDHHHGHNFISNKFQVYSAQANGPLLKEVNFTPHPLIMCCSEAYSQHYPLILSPDDIWLLIAQGFAKHVEIHSKQLRSQFISDNSECELKETMKHSLGTATSSQELGKIPITVYLEPYIQNKNDHSSCNVFKQVDWKGVVNEIVSKVNAHLIGDTLQWLQCNFTTSTYIEKTCSEIVMMSALKNYFSYRNMFKCGLPSVTLLGTLQDWESIKERTLQLEQYGMQFWIKALIPILDQFIETYKFNSTNDNPLPNSLKKFWNSIALSKVKSGSTKVTGWISYFFPYNSQNEISADLQNLSEHFLDQVDIHAWGTNASEFPSGLSSVDVAVENSPIANVHSLKYMAGFLGYDYDETWKGLKPRMGWVIASEKKK